MTTLLRDALRHSVNPHGSWWAAVQGVRNTCRQMALFAQIRASCRPIARDGPLQLWSTCRGKWWVPWNTARHLPWYLAEQARDVYHGVRAGDIVLDCGANVGAYTRLALEQGARLVIAIDMTPENVECLRRNFRGESRVLIWPKGVWSQEDRLMVYANPDDSGWNSVVLREKRVPWIDVRVSTIDRMVSELQLRRVDFIKMDIEGAEKPALAGAAATLARFRPRLALAVYHLPEDRTEIPKMLRGYRMTVGPCEYDGQGIIQPHEMYFRPTRNRGGRSDP